MKENKSKIMQNYLKRGIKMINKMKEPKEGTLRPLINETISNGWHYQVDWIKDRRIAKEAIVIVHAFKPGSQCARDADFYLSTFSTLPVHVIEQVAVEKDDSNYGAIDFHYYKSPRSMYTALADGCECLVTIHGADVILDRNDLVEQVVKIGNKKYIITEESILQY